MTDAIELQRAEIEELEKENEKLRHELRAANAEVAKLKGLVELFSLRLRQAVQKRR